MIRLTGKNSTAAIHNCVHFYWCIRMSEGIGLCCDVTHMNVLATYSLMHSREQIS